MISNIIWKHNAFQSLQIQMFKKTTCFNDFKFKYWKTQCVLMISNTMFFNDYKFNVSPMINLAKIDLYKVVYFLTYQLIWALETFLDK
jgi:hypothetical protein